jgi:hypothetical protein
MILSIKRHLIKMFGTKKNRWNHEEEIRLIFDNSGLKDHHESAITGIYFGCDVSDDLILEYSKEFSNRNIDFYKMEVNLQSNELERILIHKNEKKLKFDISKFDFELVKTIDNPSISNYYLYTRKNYNLEELKELAQAFREKFSYKSCNIYFIDNLDILDIIEIYPKNDIEYVKFAESIIAAFPFDCDDEIFSYPFKDWKYAELIKK